MLVFLTCRFFRRFLVFTVYFIIFVIAFSFRPGTDNHPSYDLQNRTDENGTLYQVNVTVKDPCYLMRVNSDEDMVSDDIIIIIVITTTATMTPATTSNINVVSHLHLKVSDQIAVLQ